MRALLIATALFLLVPGTAAAADLVIDGRGWGHGVGLSQYGAYGFALREGRDHEFILKHYYTGSELGRAPATRMRVRLKRARTQRMSSVTLARAAGRRVRLNEGRVYRFRALNGDRIQVEDATTGRTRARLRAPVTVTGGASTVLRGLAENTRRNGAYRGRMVFERDGGSVLAVNHVSLEHYLYGVVPAEMPASWPTEAVRSQAVVARSYAYTSRRPTEVWDVYADVRSQVYGGVYAEVPAATEAVRATRARVVTVGGQVAQTFFFSTSGGRTASNEEGFGGSPLPYLRSVDDPHDDLSPVHTWRARFTKREAERMLRSVLSGNLRSLRVETRTESGRAGTVLVRGSGGDRSVPAASIRTLLGLRSTWIEGFQGP
jgi:stage II sporulation protein D